MTTHNLPAEWIEIGSFIRTCREQVQSDTEMRVHRRRRIRHLTQSELAERAGVSTVIISKLEQAQYPNVNRKILQKIAIALDLTSDQQQYLYGLLQPAPTMAEVDTMVPDWLLASIREVNFPVSVINPSFDIVAHNSMYASVVIDPLKLETEQRNIMYILMCDPERHAIFENWETNVRSMVSAMKLLYSILPHHRGRIASLVSKISASEPFMDELWEQADPMFEPTISKSMQHPKFGELQFHEVISQVVGTDALAVITLVPSNDSTRAVLERLRSES